MLEKIPQKMGFWGFCDKYYWGFWFVFVLLWIYFPEHLSRNIDRILCVGGGVLVVSFLLTLFLLTVLRYRRNIVDMIYSYANLYGEDELKVTANQVIDMVFADDCTIDSFSKIMPRRKAQQISSALKRVRFPSYIFEEGISQHVRRETEPLLYKDEELNNRTVFNQALLTKFKQDGEKYKKEDIKKEVIPLLQEML